jgi:hypothetical protein
MAATTTALRPKRQADLKLTLHRNPDGEVTPVIPMTWTVSDVILDKVADGSYVNPHIVIVVAKRTRYDYGYEKGYSYRPYNVYIRPLKGTPKEYIQFKEHGDNVVVAGIVDVRNKSVAQALSTLRDRPSKFNFEIDTQKRKLTSVRVDIDPLWDGANFIAPIYQSVRVPKELFAPPPPKWARAVVTHYFPAYAVDQCDFRRRFLISMGLNVIVQPVGLLIRLGALLVGLFLLMRGMQFRQLFAINPLDFGRTFDSSFWFTDKDGRTRRGFGWRLTPPWLIIYAAILIGAAIALGIGPLAVYALAHDGDFSGFDWNEFLPMALTVDAVLAGIAVFWFFVVMKKGRRMLGDAIWSLRQKLTPNRQTTMVNPAAEIAAERQRLADEIRRQRERAEAGEVDNDTVHLRFQDLKEAVCKPYAGSRLG